MASRVAKTCKAVVGSAFAQGSRKVKLPSTTACVYGRVGCRVPPAVFPLSALAALAA